MLQDQQLLFHSFNIEQPRYRYGSVDFNTVTDASKQN